MRGLAYVAVAMLGLLLGWTGGVLAGPLPAFDGPRAAVHGWLYGDAPPGPPLSIDTVAPSSTPYASPAPRTPTARKTRPRTTGAAPARTALPRPRDGDASSVVPLPTIPLPAAAPTSVRAPPRTAARVRAPRGPEKDQTTEAPTTSAAPTTTTAPTTRPTTRPTIAPSPDPPSSSAAPSETSETDTADPTTTSKEPRCPTPRHKHCSRHW